MNVSRRASQHAGAHPSLPRIVIGILDGRYEGAMDYALRSATRHPGIITMMRPRLDPPLRSVPPLDVDTVDGPFASALVEASVDADVVVIQVPDLATDRLTDPRLMKVRRGTQSLLIEVDSAGRVVRASGPASGAAGESTEDVANGSRPFIVAGVDGSEGSDAVVDWAGKEATARGAVLRLVVVVSAGTSRRQAQRIIQAARKKTSAEVEPIVAGGEPVDVLVAQSAGAELLVVGGHSNSGMIHSALGGVGDSCARLAECPVVIVPRARVAQPVQTGADQ